MDDKQVTAEEIQALWQEDIQRLAEQAARSVNEARAGSIIADSEEPFRDAMATLREKGYEKLISLLQQKQEAFSPSADRASGQGAPEGDAPDDQRQGVD